MIRKAKEHIYQHIMDDYPRINSKKISTEFLSIVVEKVHWLHPEIVHDLKELKIISFEYLLKEFDYDPVESNRLMERYLELRHEVEFSQMFSLH